MAMARSFGCISRDGSRDRFKGTLFGLSHGSGVGGLGSTGFGASTAFSAGLSSAGLSSANSFFSLVGTTYQQPLAAPRSYIDSSRSYDNFRNPKPCTGFTSGSPSSHDSLSSPSESSLELVSDPEELGPLPRQIRVKDLLATFGKDCLLELPSLSYLGQDSRIHANSLHEVSELPLSRNMRPFHSPRKDADQTPDDPCLRLDGGSWAMDGVGFLGLGFRV